MTRDDGLEEELRRLFGDERLDVAPRMGAEFDVLAGAHRIRRRRAVLVTTGGALTVVALIAAGLLIGGLRPGGGHIGGVAAPPVESSLSGPGSLPHGGGLSSTPPGGSPATSTSPPPPGGTSGTTQQQQQSSGQSSGSPQSLSGTGTPPGPSSGAASSSTSRRVMVPMAAGQVLGPNGYGQLRLGMSFQDAKNTGMLADGSSAPSSCTGYTLREGTTWISSVRISPSAGIVSFQANQAHTPEQIRVGSSKDELDSAYPNRRSTSGGYSASAGSGGSYVFGVGNDKVTSLKLTGPSSC